VQCLTVTDSASNADRHEQISARCLIQSCIALSLLLLTVMNHAVEMLLMGNVRAMCVRAVISSERLTSPHGDGAPDYLTKLYLENCDFSPIFGRFGAKSVLSGAKPNRYAAMY